MVILQLTFNSMLKHNVLILIGTLLLCYSVSIAAPTDSLSLPVADSALIELKKAERHKAKVDSWLPDYHQHVGFTYTAGFKIVSNYLWRGFAVGGLSFQPDVNIGYGGLSIGTWWNFGATDNQFKRFFPEIDTYIRFSRWGLTINLIHMHYFDGSKFFDFKQKNIYGKGNSNNTELHIMYRVSDRLPLSFEWYTHIGSEDGFVVDESDNFVARQLQAGASTDGLRIKRAFSTYIQLGYDFQLPHGILLPVRLGMTPWRSRYTQYEKSFAVCCISLSLEKTFDLKVCRLNIFGRAMLNPDRINSENVIVRISQRNWHNNQTNSHLNGTLGIGVWF